MVATCSMGSMMYVLPMILGRTYDMNNNVVGIDIYKKEDIDAALENPVVSPLVSSVYTMIDESSQKRDFLGVSGELSLKISSGLLSIKGAGDYMRSTSKTENRIEVLVKVTFNTMTVALDPDAIPTTDWKLMDRKAVGTHVVNSLSFGGEIYASLSFVALKAEYMQEIKAKVQGSISKSGAFDIEAQGKLNMTAQNLTNKAKLEIDYYGTVPLEGVPTTLKGLSDLVRTFPEQVKKVNNGNGVAICAGFIELATFDTKFSFLKNEALMDSLDDFSYHFNDLREAKSLLKGLITSLPLKVTEEYLKKVIDFSSRLTDTLREFNKAIGNLNLEEGTGQLNAAEEKFDKNSDVVGDSRYTKEIRFLIHESNEKADPTVPRGIFVQWGSRTCDNKGSNSLYIGFMASFVERGIGAGTEYQCLPENPNWNLPSGANGLTSRNSRLGGVRYKSMTVFRGQGKKIENKVASCTVCETPMRPTVKMFPGLTICPGNWVQEYSGFVVSSNRTKNRAEYICVTNDPDSYEPKAGSGSDPVILPIKISSKNSDPKLFPENKAVPCSVCSK